MANDVANQVDSTSTETIDVEKENAVNSLSVHDKKQKS